MNYDTLLVYILVSFFYIISPGPAIFLAVYNGAVNGLKCVTVSALGNIVGLMFLSTLSISGLSAILLASSILFMVVKIIGAIYLIYLGIKQILTSNNHNVKESEKGNNRYKNLFSYFKEGFFVSVTNPKPIIFFTALFPQFLNTDQPIFNQFFIMTLIFMCFSFLSLSTYGYLANRAKGFLSNVNNVKWFHRISGGLFVAMGISLFTIKAH
ncbi:LysE family translocator [Psychromonas sp. 14N.309.X.WAT.B.A12]|jgi:threonine/homoserine/homoserine lactone efflux protein|uniref:LysE family translocator n=1 Tax=unclassified Psychromonas TaxID=2614957 RepID=UPI0025B1275F|nr:LysE family translocator [Psychromonas sp. 14N.309.X.WAT.B.A12]MDN2663847.1 LysE family translocator [Psychromonas sp. 14N.309.X.WAT.B.A12]